MQPLKVLTSTAPALFLIFILALTAPPVVAECPPMSTTPAQMNYRDIWQLQWDPANPGEIPAGGAVTLQVIGGFAPYRWQVSGDGFYLERSQSQGRSNILHAGREACGVAAVTVVDHHRHSTGGSVRLSGYDFIWDAANSPREFPDGDGRVVVYVEGGRPPYQWQVSEGFRLACTTDCGDQNTVAVVDPDIACTAEITVRDACDTRVQGFVRRPGYWRGCFYHKAPSCFVSNRCGKSPELDYGHHLVQVICCRHGADVRTGTCDVDDWEFTATGEDCTLDNDCQSPQVWGLYIWYWICY